MSELKMSPEELEAESLRLSVLIDKASEPGLQAVKEMSKRSWTLEEMRSQIIRHQIVSNWIRKGGELPIPLKVENEGTEADSKSAGTRLRGNNVSLETAPLRTARGIFGKLPRLKERHTTTAEQEDDQTVDPLSNDRSE